MFGVFLFLTLRFNDYLLEWNIFHENSKIHCVISFHVKIETKIHQKCQPWQQSERDVAWRCLHWCSNYCPGRSCQTVEKIKTLLFLMPSESDLSKNYNQWHYNFIDIIFYCKCTTSQRRHSFPVNKSDWTSQGTGADREF